MSENITNVLVSMLKRKRSPDLRGRERIDNLVQLRESIIAGT